MIEHESGAKAAFAKQLAAFNARDLEAFLDAYAADAVIERDDNPSLVGHDEMRQFYTGRFADPALHCEVVDLVELRPGRLVAHERVATTHSRTEVIATFDCNEGLIVRTSLVTRPSSLSERPADSAGG